MIDYKRFLEYLNEAGLSADELMVLYFLNQSSSDAEVYEMSTVYFANNSSKIAYKHLIKGLEDKQMLINRNKPNQFVVSKFVITQETKEKFFVEKRKAFDEVLEIYPKMTNFKGTQWSAISDEDVKLYYDIIHRGSKRLHKRFIEFTERYLRENNFHEFAPMRFDRYLLMFENIALEYESKEKPENRNYYDNLSR